MKNTAALTDGDVRDANVDKSAAIRKTRAAVNKSKSLQTKISASASHLHGWSQAGKTTKDTKGQV